MNRTTAIGLGLLAAFAAGVLSVVFIFGTLFIRQFTRHHQISQRESRHDRVDLMRLHEAERDIRNGRGREALVALAPLDVVASNRGCMITLIRASAQCMTEGSCAGVRDHVEPGEFTGLIHGCDELYQKLLLYCDHTARHASPKAAAELIGLALYADSWLSPRCDLQLLQADYYLRGGARKQAAALCQRLWDDGMLNSWHWSYVKDDVAFMRQLTALKKQAGESDERWLTAKDIQAFPTNCAIYLQPLGAVDMKVLEPVRANVQAFFGAPVSVLPAIPLTHWERSYMPKEAKYDADHMRPDMIKKLRVPADAFSVVLITGEKIGTLHIDWIYSQSKENQHLISYHVWRPWDLHWKIVALSNVVVSDLSKQLGLCGEFPCVSCSAGDMDAMRRVKLAYSPAIQERYRRIDLLAAKEASIRSYRDWGAAVAEP